MVWLLLPLLICKAAIEITEERLWDSESGLSRNNRKRSDGKAPSCKQFSWRHAVWGISDSIRYFLDSYRTHPTPIASWRLVSYLHLSAVKFASCGDYTLSMTRVLRAAGWR